MLLSEDNTFSVNIKLKKIKINNFMILILLYG